MEDIYPKVINLLEEGRLCVLATVVRLKGSAPRGVGTKLLILEDGSFEGTIGGGLLEARVLKHAGMVFEANRPLRVPFFLRGEDVAAGEMICGGDAEVFLEPLPPGNREILSVIKRAAEIEVQGGSGVLATILNEEHWRETGVPRVLLERDGGYVGSFQGLEEIVDQCREAVPGRLRTREPGIQIFEDKAGRPVEVFLEPLTFKPMLYVFGGGHVSRQLVPLAAGVGFKVVVIDDRPEYTETGLFAGAAETRCLPFEGVLERLDVDQDSYLVIVTRGHLYDKTVLEQCLNTRAAYIGMIGSRCKVALIFKKMLEEGAREEDVRRVHSPIGLSIGAETPAEIAVSIVAELIQVRARSRSKWNLPL
ncbi:MAG: XdhC family protein [Desulfatiglandales bacterium]